VIQLEQGVDEARLSLPRRIVNGIGSVACMTAAFCGALGAVDGTLRALDEVQVIPALAEPLHQVVEHLGPETVTAWASQNVLPGWRGIGEMALGLAMHWAFHPIGEGLHRESL